MKIQRSLQRSTSSVQRLLVVAYERFQLLSVLLICTNRELHRRRNTLVVSYVMKHTVESCPLIKLAFYTYVLLVNNAVIWLREVSMKALAK